MRGSGRETMRRAFAIVAVSALLAAALFAVGCGSDDGTTSGDTKASGSSRAPAGDFSGTLMDGTAVSLASFAGKPLVVIFWGSW